MAGHLEQPTRRLAKGKKTHRLYNLEEGAALELITRVRAPSEPTDIRQVSEVRNV